MTTLAGAAQALVRSIADAVLDMEGIIDPRERIFWQEHIDGLRFARTSLASLDVRADDDAHLRRVAERIVRGISTRSTPDDEEFRIQAVWQELFALVNDAPPQSGAAANRMLRQESEPRSDGSVDAVQERGARRALAIFLCAIERVDLGHGPSPTVEPDLPDACPRHRNDAASFAKAFAAEFRAQAQAPVLRRCGACGHVRIDSLHDPRSTGFHAFVESPSRPEV